MKISTLWDRSGRSLPSQVNAAYRIDSDQRGWNVLYTRPNWEKKVSRNLASKGVEYYCPLVKSQRQWSDRRKIISVPLFPSYVFVRINPNSLGELKTIEGVLNYLYWLKKPAVVKMEEIDIIKKFIDGYQNVKVEKSIVQLNADVRILSGPLMEKEGKIIEIKNRSVKVHLPSLGYNLMADIQKSNIELLSLGPTKTSQQENA